MSNPLSTPMMQPVNDRNISAPQGNLAEQLRSNPQLVREHGEPMCPSVVTRFLQAIDERLFMRAFPFPTGWEWAMCESWGENDPRRMTIRTGETPPDRAFDVVGYVPSDKQIASADEACDFLVRSLRSSLQMRPDFEKYLAAISDHNTRQSDRNLQPVREYAQELAEANTSTIFAEQGKTVTKVFQNQPSDKTGTKRTKGRDATIPKPA